MFLVEYPLRHLEDISAWHEKHNSLGQLVSVILVMGTTLEFSKEPLKIGFLASTKITALHTTALLWTFYLLHDARQNIIKDERAKAQSTKPIERATTLALSLKCTVLLTMTTIR